MDKRTLLATGLVVLMFVGWQQYLNSKYPNRNQVPGQKPEIQKSEATNITDASEGGTNSAASPSGESVPAVKAESTAIKEEVKFDFEDEFIATSISSNGMSLSGVTLKKYKDQKDQWVEVANSRGAESGTGATSWLGSRAPIQFEIVRREPNVFVGVANEKGVQITKTITISSVDYSIQSHILLEGSGADVRGVSSVLHERIKSFETPSIFSGRSELNMQSLFLRSLSKTEHLPIDAKFDGETAKHIREVGVRVAAVASHYFISAVVDKSPIEPEVRVDISAKENNEKLMTLSLDYPLVFSGAPVTLQFINYVGPKSLSLLTKTDSQLADSIDFGWFGWIGKPLLKMLKQIYGICGNYGIAIIILTLMVRLAVLPFNIMSYKSMKAMQVVQPQMKILQEKYKNDRQTLNVEVMKLMKENKANPLGGCLPILLQLPIFIALYRVFGNSIELYRAPFALWIQDLSLKDQYYVLPILMGAAMYIQQKITPSAMDETQKKIMNFMPIIFTLFMVSLPSGLTLYMFVTTVFGILQQKYFMREKRISDKPAEILA